MKIIQQKEFEVFNLITITLIKDKIVLKVDIQEFEQRQNTSKKGSKRKTTLNFI